MIESGYIYIVDGASFVLFKYFFRGRQIAFFLVLGRLPFALSCTPWRVLGALTQELRSSRSAETFVAECFPDFHVASQHDLQAQALHLGWAGHSSGWSWRFWLVLARVFPIFPPRYFPCLQAAVRFTTGLADERN